MEKREALFCAILELFNSLSPCWSILSSWEFLAFTSLYFPCRVEKQKENVSLLFKKHKQTNIQEKERHYSFRLKGISG